MKNPPAKAGEPGEEGSIPTLGRSPGEGNGNPPQYSFLENSMHRGISWATVHGVTKSWTRLSPWACTKVQNIRKLPPNYVHPTRSEKSAANLIYSLMKNQSDLFLNHMTMSGIVFYLFFSYDNFFYRELRSTSCWESFMFALPIIFFEFRCYN